MRRLTRRPASAMRTTSPSRREEFGSETRYDFVAGKCFLRNLWYLCVPVRTLTAFIILAETTTPQMDWGGGPGIFFFLWFFWVFGF
ncbi:hypothetical protein BDR22DRAFT_875566 [Usnea florida]